MCQTTANLDPGRPWRAHTDGYRHKEMRKLAGWISTNTSGSVIGLSGSGKSDMIGFLCHRPEAWEIHLPEQTPPVTLLPVDLNNLPARTLSALYRVILRAFFENRYRFTAHYQERIIQLYEGNRGASDPFLPQSGLRELLLDFQGRGDRLVFVLDRFDSVCSMLTPQMGDTLRGLRDSFKDTLSYIAGMRQGLAYLPEPEILGGLYRLLDAQVCYVGPMIEADMRHAIGLRTSAAPAPPNDDEMAQIWSLTGGYPSLVQMACQWWVTTSNKPALEGWLDALMAEPGVRYRLGDIWSGLTQEEQMVLTEVQKSRDGDQPAQTAIVDKHSEILDLLVEKGLCVEDGTGWRPFSELFAAHVADVGEESRGKIWLDPQTEILRNGQGVIDNLTPKERDVLQFLAQQPKVRHTYTDIIVAAWTGDEGAYGVTNESLFQIIRGLRQKIEPNPSHPVYIINWRGNPEGGYQFFPEGRPG